MQDTTNRPGTHHVVELYNYFERMPDGRSRGPSNGWYVARYVDGLRQGGHRDFERDEDAARRYAQEMNRETGQRITDPGA
jgi:hypothetical protein